MSTTRLAVIGVQLTIIVCLLMVAYTFLMFSAGDHQTPVAAAAASLFAGGNRAIHIRGNGAGPVPAAMLGDGAFVISATHPIKRPRTSRHAPDDDPAQALVLERYDEHELRARQLSEKIDRLTGAHSFVIGAHAPDEAERRRLTASADAALRAYDNVTTQHAHLFYQAPVRWYAPNQPDDARFIRDASGEADTANRLTVEQPLNSVYYPLLGLYTLNTRVLDAHFRNIIGAGFGVLVVGWQPSADPADPAAASLDIIRHLLDFARRPPYNGRLSIALELQPYASRSLATLRADLERLRDQFVWSHPALYRVHEHGRPAPVPLLYVRDACQLAAADDWALWQRQQRAAATRAVLIGEIGGKADASLVRRALLNGFYTRAASNGATYASTWKNWDMLQQMADRYRLLFVPTVAPGYAERDASRTALALHRHRSHGQYYGVAWRTATAVGARFVAVASYNDWAHGTQIEEAVPMAGHRDYQPSGPRKYLDLSRHWLSVFVQQRSEQFAEDALRAHRAQVLGKTRGKAPANADDGWPLGCVKFFNNTVC